MLIERPVKELQPNLSTRVPATQIPPLSIVNLQPNLSTRVPAMQIPPASVNVNTNAIKPTQTGESQTGMVEIK